MCPRTRRRTFASQPHLAVSECHHEEAVAVFHQVNCTFSWADTSVSWCVNTIYTIRANDDIWQRANPTLLPLHPPPPKILSSVLTTTAGSNHSITSELHCNKSPPLPLFLFFLCLLLFSSLSFLFFFFFRNEPEQQKTTGHQQASKLSPPPSSGRRTAKLGAPSFWFLPSPRYRPRCIYLAHLCFCVINIWKL